MGIGKVCASVSAETCADVMIRIREAEELADIIEIRFDHLRKEEVPLLIRSLVAGKVSKPMIATFRSADQGGRREISIEERREFWAELPDIFWAADVEEDIFESASAIRPRIVSSHVFDGNGTGSDDVFERLNALDPSFVKYAYLAEDAINTIAVWKLLERAAILGQPAICIAMGEAGKITRILGPARGSCWTYGSLSEKTAPGQLSVNDLVNLYRVRNLNRETRVYAVIGDPVSRSRSPQIHNAAFSHTGLNAVFLPLLVKDLDGFFKRMVLPAKREVDLNFHGFSVTMPHKVSVMKYLDEIDETAAAIGAVNTIAIQDGRLTGFNTDADGFIGPLLSRLGKVSGCNAVVFGAGGAARACIYALKRKGVSVTVVARDPAKAAELAKEFEVDSDKIGNEDLSAFDIVINATPVGMADDRSPFDTSGLWKVRLIYDIVTTAQKTALIQAAEAAGVETITGVDMLVAQAMKQSLIWTGESPPADVLTRAARI